MVVSRHDLDRRCCGGRCRRGIWRRIGRRFGLGQGRHLRQLKDAKNNQVEGPALSVAQNPPFVQQCGDAEGKDHGRTGNALQKDVLVHCVPPLSRIWRNSSHAPTAITMIGHPRPTQSKRRIPSVLKRKSIPAAIRTIAPTGSGRRPRGPQQDGSPGTGGIGGTGSYQGGGGTGGTTPAACAASVEGDAEGGQLRFGMPIFCPSSFNPKGSGSGNPSRRALAVWWASKT